MIEAKLSKDINKDEADPNQCIGLAFGGTKQCPFQKVPGKDFCQKCLAGNHNTHVKENVRNYRLTKLQARMEEKADSSSIKSLREEIGIARLVLEEIINRCENTVDLVINSHKISDLVTRIQKLVESCHRLEKSNDLLLDKSAILQLAGLFIEIINNHVKDEAVIDLISEDILNSVNEMKIHEPKGTTLLSNV